MELVVANLDKHFKNLKATGTTEVTPGDTLSANQVSVTSGPVQHLAETKIIHSGFGSYNRKQVKTGGGISYGQPQFFSPVYTPINWQIPSRRRELYMWARFWYENEPRVATALDFYSRFPITGFETECSNMYVKHYFDELNKKLNMDKWARIISHEVHLIGDCFPFLEIECETCGGSGRVGGEICEHEGGSFKRLLILNPDFVEVFTNPISPEEVITYVPDDELRDIVLKNGPGSDKLSPEVKKMIAQGRPIPLDARCISHLKHGESGYRRYGISMTRRLFPILSYKTKIMTAQWIVAERMIVPIKVVKVGSDERPASESDIATVQSQLMSTSNDPNLCIVTHHAFDMDFVGASGKILPISGEYEFINQEILDGFGLNKQLITGEGPNYSGAGMGAEIMIKRLESWRLELKRWIEEKIYLPVAKMRGFKEKNEWGEEEWIYPKIRWDSLNLRDRQQERQMMLQLYDKGLVSAHRVLEEFDIDPDTEFEQMRYERIEMMTQQPPGQAAGGAGGGGMDLGGGGGGGGLSLGGGMDTPPEGGMGGPPGADAGGMPPPPGGGGAGGAMGGGMGAPASSRTMIVRTAVDDFLDRGMQKTAQSDPSLYGGKILTKETREKLDREREKIKKQKEKHEHEVQDPNGSGDGFMRDPKGRIMMTGIEKKVIKGIEQKQIRGQIRYNAVPSYEVYVGSRPVVIDIAFPDIFVGVECDGSTFHGAPDQKKRDEARDNLLRNLGWVIIRFGEEEIESRFDQVMMSIVNEIDKRELWIRQEREKLKERSKESKLGQ